MRRISVAIATYNRAHILPETLSYILCQTAPADEIVIVDDGSSDNTPDVVKAHPGPIRYLRIDNAGPGAALKTAIEACSSEWIAMCDDDDQWLPDHLERRHQMLNRFPEVDYSFSNFTSFGPGAQAGFDEFANIPARWWPREQMNEAGDYCHLGRGLFRQFLDYNPVFPTSVCLKRALYDAMGGIDAQFSRLGCWDAHFTWRSVLHGEVACDRRITVSTRKHVNNFSRKRSHVNLQRADMLGQAWADGWIPAPYRADVERALTEANLRAARWAWMDRDYDTFDTALARVAPGQIPVSLRARRVFAKGQLLLRPRR
jgi:glycosyltransferase involved in cell wall biosynthesis